MIVKALHRWPHVAGLLALFLLIGWTYRPALSHPPREDQWSFLLDTFDEDRFVPLLLKTYSYNRTRVIFPGDYALFRPGLFALLSAEKALFGHRTAYWQAFGIGLHCAVVGVFLALLLRLARLFPVPIPAVRRLRVALAYMLALFFGVNFACTEMVVWHHIHGYMLYTLLVLGGVFLLLGDICGDGSPASAWRLAGAFALILAAAFTYETGSVFAVVLGGALGLAYARRRLFRRAVFVFALFASILVVYRTADRLDQLAHPNPAPDVSFAAVLAHARLGPTLEHAGRYVLFTLVQPFFPSAPGWDFGTRLVMPEPGDAPERFFRWKQQLFFGYAVVLVGASLAVWRFGRLLASRRVLAASPLLLLLLGLLALHLVVIVLGRMNLRPGPLVLMLNSYYAYTPLLLLLVGAYFLWVRLAPARPRLECATLLLLLLAFGAIADRSAHKVHAMTELMAARQRPLIRRIATLDELIEQHGRDPRFGISFSPELRETLDSYHGLWQLEILYFRFIDHDAPTHVLCAEGGGYATLPIEEFRRTTELAPIPRFVGPDRGFMIYEHDGEFSAIPQSDGRFDSSRDDYNFLVRGRSVDEVVRLIPEAGRCLDAARSQSKYIPARTVIFDLRETSNGFDLYLADDWVYAIPHGRGPLSSSALLADHSPRWYRGKTVEEVKRRIDEGEFTRAAERMAEADSAPAREVP
jgi:hypothetical protein